MQMFELLTADYLFDPQGQGELFTKDDDHMAQIIELVGDFPLDAKMGGKYSRELFDHQGMFSRPTFPQSAYADRLCYRSTAVHSLTQALAVKTGAHREILTLCYRRHRPRCVHGAVAGARHERPQGSARHGQPSMAHSSR